MQGRLYNPNERPFFQGAQALDGETHVGEPYLSAWAGPDSTTWLLTYAKAIYDRKTGEFIGVVSVDIETSGLADVVNSIAIGETGIAALVRWDSGTVVASVDWTDKSQKMYAGVTGSAGLPGIGEKVWADMSEVPSGGIDLDKHFSIKRGGKDYLVTRAPILYADDGESTPGFMLILMIAKNEILDAVSDMQVEIDSDSSTTIVATLLITLGIGTIMIFSTLRVAYHITKPLKDMTITAKKIISNAAGDLAEVRVERAIMTPPILGF